MFLTISFMKKDLSASDANHAQSPCFPDSMSAKGAGGGKMQRRKNAGCMQGM
jgi:hypothetical protein